MGYLGHLANRTGKGTPTVEELGNDIAVLDREWRRLEDAMWAELDAALKLRISGKLTLSEVVRRLH
jgi:hypothetical protein